MAYQTMNAFTDRMISCERRMDASQRRLGNHFPVITTLRKIRGLEASIASRSQPGYDPSKDKFSRYKDETVARLIEKEGAKWREYWDEPNPYVPFKLKLFEDGYGWSERRDPDGKVDYTTIAGPNGYALRLNEDSIKALAVLRWDLPFETGWKHYLISQASPQFEFVRVLSNQNAFCTYFLTAIGERETIRLMTNSNIYQNGADVVEKLAGIVKSDVNGMADRIVNDLLCNLSLGYFAILPQVLRVGDNAISLAKYLKERGSKAARELIAQCPI